MASETAEIELVALREQLKAIQASLDEVKATLHKMVEIDHMVSELKVRQEGVEDKVRHLSSNADLLETAQVSNSEYLNKIRGGVSLASLLFGLIQALLMAGGGWMLNTIIDTREELRVLKQSVRHLEAEQDRLYAVVHQVQLNAYQRKDIKK